MEASKGSEISRPKSRKAELFEQPWMKITRSTLTLFLSQQVAAGLRQRGIRPVDTWAWTMGDFSQKIVRKGPVRLSPFSWPAGRAELLNRNWL